MTQLKLEDRVVHRNDENRVYRIIKLDGEKALCADVRITLSAVWFPVSELETVDELRRRFFSS